MICSNCKNEIIEGLKFCPKCGHEIVCDANEDKAVSNKNTKKIKALIAVVSVIMIIAFIFACFSIINIMKCKNEVKEDLSLTLSVLTMQNESDNNYYIYSVDNDEFSLFMNDELAKSFGSKCTYKIEKIKIKNDEAVVKLSVSSPDIYKFLSNNVDPNKKYKSEELSDMILKNIDSNISLATNEFEVELIKINGHWYLKPNSDLSNALSGNMVSWYSGIGENIVNGLLEE